MSARIVRNVSAVAGQSEPTPWPVRHAWVTGKRMGARGRSCTAKSPAEAARKAIPAFESLSGSGISRAAARLRTAMAAAAAAEHCTVTAP